MAALYLLFLSSKAEIFLSFLYTITQTIRCKMMGGLCFLIALCSVIEFYKRVFQAFVGFFLMDRASSLKLLLTKYNDYGCGFLIFGYFSRFFNVLVLLFMFVLGFKFLQFSGHHYKFRVKPKGGRKGWLSLKMCSNGDDFDGVKNLTLKCGTTLCKGCGDQKLGENNEGLSSNCGFQKERCDSEDEEECCDEDQVFDVMALRKMVKVERRRAKGAHYELEKERMAASSSVDEAMAMILRLQNEKSALQIQANQLQRVAEEKQLHDQEVIQSLQWIIMKHESERSLLEDQLRLCREKLRMFMKGDEWDQFDDVCPTPSASHSSFGSRDNDVLVGSLELDSSPM